MINEILLQLYVIVTEIAALPFRILNQVIETFDNIWLSVYPKAEAEETEETNEDYHKPPKVKGFHSNNDEETNK